MRISVCLSTAFSLAIVGPAFAGDDVAPQDLPNAVRQTLEKEAKDATIEDVERETRGGKVIYEVELERNDEEWKLKIDESGKVIERRRDT